MKKYLLYLLFIILVAGSGVGGFLYGKTKARTIENVVQKCVYNTNAHSDLTWDNYLVVLNEYRLSLNLPMFITDFDLQKYAQARAEEIESGKQSIGHQTDLGTFWEFTGSKKFKFVSEDDQGWYNDTYQAVDGFKNSPTHNASITNPQRTHIGIGIKGGIIVLELGSL